MNSTLPYYIEFTVLNVDISNLREKQKERFLNLAEFLKDLAARIAASNYEAI